MTHLDRFLDWLLFPRWSNAHAIGGVVGAFAAAFVLSGCVNG